MWLVWIGWTSTATCWQLHPQNIDVLVVFDEAQTGTMYSNALTGHVPVVTVVVRILRNPVSPATAIFANGA